MSDETPAGLLKAALAADAARPFVTFYGETEAERVELSFATFDNWVAKTANLLVDELAADPGDRVVLLLPLHWQTAVWLVACWSVGLVACPARYTDERGADVPGTDVDIVAAGPDALDAALELGARETVALSLHPLGAPLPEVPPGVIDYATEVRGQGDRFLPYAPVDPAAPALRLGGPELSGADLCAQARAAAKRWDLTASERVLSAVGFDTAFGVLASLLAPLAVGASVVLSRDGDMPEDLLVRRVTTERVTAVAGIPATGLGCRSLPTPSEVE
ncbi:MAG: TIGR03089 family protein [Streptosporangiales bacterium]|nr:TIGR03089 family protein [Streptosporangiales bacterium]